MRFTILSLAGLALMSAGAPHLAHAADAAA